MTRLDWVEDSTKSVWNVFTKFDTWKEHWKLSVPENINAVQNGKQCWDKTNVNR